ncbi:antibiotic biosynthesis monooxygenase [Alteromonas sp. 5E99-2]|uniref:putative quinol monooxygenase n=1 Tax=Alteromonas sp. 5E99-2 TaxID=2817683 RepID=UPI001A983CA4|nr:antibiotic biosynthesis monooxygenase [Alteromonas sp. 5E99-2]MBO1255542.1 antibiotic biosynthesis monooxygenase [Alteromonas sp. 5E99-2]
MVTLKGFILVPIEDFEIVKDALVLHKALTRQEIGCEKFEVVQDSANPYKFSVHEEFIDQAAFEHHQKRVKLSHWGSVTKNVERHYQISNIP